MRYRLYPKFFLLRLGYLPFEKAQQYSKTGYLTNRIAILLSLYKYSLQNEFSATRIYSGRG